MYFFEDNPKKEELVRLFISWEQRSSEPMLNCQDGVKRVSARIAADEHKIRLTATTHQDLSAANEEVHRSVLACR